MRARAGLGVLAAALTVAGCGLKGPLYLPEKPGPVTTRPGPAAPANPPATAPGTSPTAAPATAPATPPATPVETPPLPPAAGDKTGG
jgi:predicted small lipoprotein YifL